LDIGSWVVIQNEELVRLACVTSKPIILPEASSEKPLSLPGDRRIIRAATQDDLAQQAENQVKEEEEFDFCLSAVKRLKLSMKLVAAEKTFDNYQTIFYYTADDRVDFRQLLRDLVRRLRTKVEMRQISVRHEALMLGGMGLCGRPFCCSSFLRHFFPVSVRMAKQQNISGNSVKISGVCGRLMCCLGFEHGSRAENPDKAQEGPNCCLSASCTLQAEGTELPHEGLTGEQASRKATLPQEGAPGGAFAPGPSGSLENLLEAPRDLRDLNLVAFLSAQAKVVVSHPSGEGGSCGEPPQPERPQEVEDPNLDPTLKEWES
jgi:cell fate regulator YaaT (PSP1 superfamily)